MPTNTECPQCRRGNVPCIRFNVQFMGESTHLQATMLLCAICIDSLWKEIYGLSVEDTPRHELDTIPGGKATVLMEDIPVGGPCSECGQTYAHDVTCPKRARGGMKRRELPSTVVPLDREGKPSKLRDRMKWRLGL
jgi:hypothetical protein